MGVDVIDELLRAFRGDFLVVVAREERATVDLVVLAEELLDTNESLRVLVGEREDVQPGYEDE